MYYDIAFYWIVHLKKNILYLKRCGYVFSILVVDKTYVINLLGFNLYIYIYIYIYIHIYIHTHIYIYIYIIWTVEEGDF